MKIRTVSFVGFCFLMLMSCQDQVNVSGTDDKNNSTMPAITAANQNKTKASKQVASGDPLQMNITNVSAKQGEETCMSIKTTRFQGILGYQHSIQFDPAELTFKKATNFGLAHLTEANFGATKAAQGMINFLWFDMNVKGVSAEDGSTVFDICFEVLAKSGTKCEVSITDTPTKIEVVGPNKTKLPFNANSGFVTVE